MINISSERLSDVIGISYRTPILRVHVRADMSANSTLHPPPGELGENYNCINILFFVGVVNV